MVNLRKFDQIGRLNDPCQSFLFYLFVPGLSKESIEARLHLIPNKLMISMFKSSRFFLPVPTVGQSFY